MAGRHAGVSHVAGSSTKTMLNGDRMRVATGAAAFLCEKHRAPPRAAGREHVRELEDVVFERGDYSDTLKAGRAPRGR